MRCGPREAGERTSTYRKCKQDVRRCNDRQWLLFNFSQMRPSTDYHYWKVAIATEISRPARQ